MKINLISIITQFFSRKDRIISIEELDNKTTIDIETDGNHLFFVNGVLTHNCGYATQEIDMDNASESGGIPATADCMFGVFQLEGEREANKINLKVIKNRYGGFIGTTIPIEVNYDTLQIKDWNEDEYEDEEDDKQISSIQHDKDELDKALDDL